MTQFKVNYRYRETMFRITVIELAEGEGNPGITVDGVEQSGTTLRLVDDRIEHVAEVRMRRG